ncbi:FHA domain-containing protein [Streptomyces sp. NPDC051940]|uniref:FHA domain-containing protein n=1 Tax=Streptomyces sp. NPDC051940 TaxID=3155675 RepID=UPI00341497FF
MTVAGPQGLERHLARFPEQADALVDLSNVVRDTAIGGPRPRDLGRLRLVVEALARRTGDAHASVYAVADRSLRHGVHEYADRAEPALLARWAAEGLVEELPDADERLMDLAEMTGLPVISRDGFADFRLTHPWIQGNTTQFLAAEPTRVRAVRLRERDMGVRSPAQISRKLEESDLKAYGLLQGRHRRPRVEVVRRYWRCPQRGCTLYDSRTGNAVTLPRVKHGVPVCALHALPLHDDGPRTGVVQLKLLVDGECVHRFTFDVDTTVVVGRAPGDGGLALFAHVPEPRLARISRRHLEVSVTAGALRLRNLSGGGTGLLRRGAGSAKPLAGDSYTTLNTGDLVQLTDGVALTRSGRRFPAEIAAAWNAAPHPAPGSAAAGATTFLDRPPSAG